MHAYLFIVCMYSVTEAPVRPVKLMGKQTNEDMKNLEKIKSLGLLFVHVKV